MQAACITRGGWILAIGLVCLLPQSGRAGEVKLPGGESLQNVDFERHVMGLFGGSAATAAPATARSRARAASGCRCSATIPKRISAP